MIEKLLSKISFIKHLHCSKKRIYRKTNCETKIMKTKPVSDENLRDVEQMIIPPEKKVIKRMKTSTVKSDTIKCLSDYTIQLYKGL